MKPTISLAMIIKDEEAVFDKCLASVKDVVDEIVIVTTGTNPRTTDIARKYTDKVFPFKWVHDFSKARNYSFDQCTKEWILWCFHPDARVHTDHGLVPISEVRIGDKVLTHGGRYMPVNQLYVRDYDGEMIRLRSKMSERDILVTPNHEFYSCKANKCKTDIKFCKPDCQKQWSKRYLKTLGRLSRQCKQSYSNYLYNYKPIEGLCVGDILAFPRMRQNIFEPIFQDIQVSKGLKDIPEKIEITPDFMRLIGYYVSEGTTDIRTGKFAFCFHKKETFYHDDVLLLMKNIFNMGGKVDLEEGPKGGSARVIFNSKPLSILFYSILNGLQPHRCLPTEWLHLSDLHLSEFIKGYYRGDGGENPDSFAMTTTSYRLVEQLRLILSRFGIFSNVIPYKKKKAWKVIIGGKQMNVFENIIGEKHDKVSPNTCNKFFYSDASYLYHQISSFVRGTYKGKVYNLGVEGDHTYIVEYMTSHNCDGDDEIPPADAEKIKNYDFSGKDVIICDYFYARDEFGVPSCNVPRERIIRRSLNLKWHKRVHEYLPMGNYTQSDIAVWHHKQHGTSERNIQILEMMIAENDYDSRDVFYLAKEYQDFERQDEALKYFMQFVTMPGAFWEDVFRSYHYMAQIWLQKGDEAKFKENLYKSIEMEERRAEPYCLMGDYYIGKQQWDKAIHWFNIATHVRRPRELLSAYQPEYNTWLPFLQQTVCWNNLGRIREAYECNEKVLEYRPKDSRALNNKVILKNALKKDQYLKDGGGKKLNLGCGGKAMPGYWNCDLFKGKGVDEVLGMDDIPYREGTIAAINSEHSLEHLSFDQVRPTICEWFRVLSPGGELMLKIPDLENCCRSYLAAPVNSDNFFKTKFWYKCTLFGIQKSQAGEPDEAQFHRSGFNKEEMSIILNDAGFIIDYMKNYDGWGTPSLEVRAVKPASPMKIGWVAPENWDAAQTRIRVLRVNQWLRAHGYHSKLVNYPEIINEGYDVCIAGKGFDENHFKNIRMLKQHRKTLYLDICESLFEFPWYKEILAVCDKVICCSHVLAEQVKDINPNVLVIEDAYEV